MSDNKQENNIEIEEEIIDKKSKSALRNMFTLDNIAFPFAIISIFFTFIFNFAYILAGAKWLLITTYFLSFGFAITSLIFSLFSVCGKEKVLFLPSMVVAIVALLAIII